MKNFLNVALKNIKLLLTVDPYNYRLTILRLLTFFGFIFGVGQYIILNLMNSFYKSYPERSLLVQIDFFAAILVLIGGVILFKQVKRGAVEVASHILIILLLIIAVRVESTLGRLEVSMTVMTLGIITAGVIIKPIMSILYGVFSLAALYLLDIHELHSAARVSILLTLSTAIFLAYLISRVITDSFNRNKDQNEKLRTHVAEKRNVEGLLMRRNRELKILNSIGKALNSTLDVDEILSSMLKEIIEQREVYSASVWLVDEKSGKNVCRQISGPQRDIEILKGMELEPGRGIVGKAIAMGEVVRVDDTAVDPNHLTKVAALIGAEIRSILSVPIKYRGRCLGTIQLVHQEVNYFNEEDVETTKAIANMAATALEKATLHNEVKTQLSMVKKFGDALKQSQLELKTASAVSEESLRRKQEFLANIGHEIRTPLNALVGMAELLGDEVSEADRKEYLGIIKSATSNLLGTINDLLDFTKVESGKLKLREEIFSLKETIEEIKSMVRIEAEGKGLNLKFEFGKTVPDHLIGDQFRLKQILINLIENAIKFTDRGRVIVRVQLGKSSVNLSEILFEIEDSGRGIPEDMQEKIFETFEQVRIQKERISKGIGLGLSIVKSLVDAHGGTIALVSEVKKGSKFTVKLKYRNGEFVEKPLLKENIEEISNRSTKTINVLLVDDNKVNQIVAKKILSRANMKVFLASKGREAIEFLIEGKHLVDIVLLDLELPDISGFKVASEIRKSRDPSIAHLPIIALTAHALEDVKTEVLEAGMDDYITKPFIPEVLINTISKKFKAPVKTGNVDLGYLISATNNDVPLMKEMIEQFFIQIDEIFVLIDENIVTKSWSEVVNLVHQIKPSIAYMGIGELKSLIDQFSILIHSDQPDYSTISLTFEKMKEAYSEAIPELAKFRKNLD